MNWRALEEVVEVLEGVLVVLLPVPLGRLRGENRGNTERHVVREPGELVHGTGLEYGEIMTL